MRENITVDGQTLTSRGNGNVLVYGQLGTSTLAELRQRVHARLTLYYNVELDVASVSYGSPYPYIQQLVSLWSKSGAI